MKEEQKLNQETNNLLSKEQIEYIFYRFIKNALDNNEEYEKEVNDFNAGKRLASFEFLSILFNELETNNIDEKQYELDKSVLDKFI